MRGAYLTLAILCLLGALWTGPLAPLHVALTVGTLGLGVEAGRHWWGGWARRNNWLGTNRCRCAPFWTLSSVHCCVAPPTNCREECLFSVLSVVI